jgi:hypothetical protein
MAYMFTTQSGSRYTVRDGRLYREADHAVIGSTAGFDGVAITSARVVVGERAAIFTTDGPLSTSRVVTREALCRTSGQPIGSCECYVGRG